MEQLKTDTSPHSPETQKLLEESPSKASTCHKPPPYSPPRAGDLGQPLLTVGGWNFYHAGIEWNKGSLPNVYYGNSPYRTRAVLLLAIQAVNHPNKIAVSPAKTPCLKLEIVQDNVFCAPNIPKRLWTNGLMLVCCEAKGQRSKRTIIAAADSEASAVFLKLRPRPDPEDTGTYFVSITIEQWSKLAHTDPTIMKFDFHIQGSIVDTVERNRVCAWARGLWSRPSIGEPVDNERTPEAAKLDLPYLEQ